MTHREWMIAIVWGLLGYLLRTWMPHRKKRWDDHWHPLNRITRL